MNYLFRPLQNALKKRIETGPRGKLVPGKRWCRSPAPFNGSPVDVDVEGVNSTTRTTNA